MNISITIMAHPKRRKQANALLVKLAAYPFKQCYITWDQINDEWHTGERALRCGASAAAEWHVVLQDDAIIPDDFYHHVVSALQNVPDRTLISLYTGRVRPLGHRVKQAVDNAKAANASWLKHYMLFWGVGIVIPTRHIEALLEFVDSRKELYDIRIGMFYQRNMLPVFYTNPSLVDHDDDLGTLLSMPATKEPRVAHNFIAGNVNWNSNFVDI